MVNLIHRERHRYPMNSRTDGHQNWSGRFAKENELLKPLEFKIRQSSPQPSSRLIYGPNTVRQGNITNRGFQIPFSLLHNTGKPIGQLQVRDMLFAFFETHLFIPRVSVSLRSAHSQLTVMIYLPVFKCICSYKC